MKQYILINFNEEYVYSGTIYEIAEYLKRPVKSLRSSISKIKNKEMKYLLYKGNKYQIIEFEELIGNDNNE